ncbi:MAG: hypothetical protein HY821_09605 [Acidobacteria bacterium]|nr:hypothetical protein [Acidobacteriota bacterium]
MIRLLFGLLICLLTCRAGDDTSSLRARFGNVKRLYIDKFGGGDGSSQLRDMVIASLQKTGLFVVTENPDKADAVMRGSAEDLVFTDTFQSGESVGGRSNLGVGRGASTRTRDYLALGAGVSDSESTRIQERKHEASASVRIVSRDGDVLWSTTQESQGAKFRSASADVAEKIAHQLALDLDKARLGKAAPGAAAPGREGPGK